MFQDAGKTMSFIQEENDVTSVRSEQQALWGWNPGLCIYGEVGEITSSSNTAFLIKFQNTVDFLHCLCEVNAVLQQLTHTQTKAIFILTLVFSYLGIASARLDGFCLEYSFCSCSCFFICQLLLCTNRNYLGPIYSLVVWGGGIFFLLLEEWVYWVSPDMQKFFFLLSSVESWLTVLKKKHSEQVFQSVAWRA